MTCIVGVEHEGRVWMGGDSAGVSGWLHHQRTDAKVFRRGPFIMGFTTSFRMGQLLRYTLDATPQQKAQGDHEYLATTFVDAVRRCLKDGGFAKLEAAQEEGGDFLVGYRGHLYQVCSDYQVASNSAGFDSVGCGREIALGALHVTEGQPPRRRVATALEAATRFSAGVSAPFHIIKDNRA